MKVVFVSNFFNHHQKPFCDAMYGLMGKDYAFVETAEISEERKKLGWGISETPEYVIPCLAFHSLKEKCKKLILDADVVIFGSAPRELLDERIRAKKTIFFYSERPLKNGFAWWKYPIRLFTWRKLNPQRKNIFMLCASAYTAADYAKFGLYKKSAYKWGYFPETKTYNDIDKLLADKEENTILWVARFLDCKHPEKAIFLAKKLKENGKKFKLNMIGTGPLENEMKVLIKENDLSDYVTILGSMTPEKVREYMEKSRIFIFTSDRGEGWGAVLNESMNSACAVVASHAIGSVPFLINDGVNGLIYQDGNEDDLYIKTKKLLDDKQLCRSFGENAYNTLTDEWNAEVVAKRFMELAEAILRGDKDSVTFKTGPCSKAEILKDNWYTV